MDRALRFASASPGKSTEARIVMITMQTNSSSIVKAREAVEGCDSAQVKQSALLRIYALVECVSGIEMRGL